MNEKLFGKRPVWHIVVICLIVGLCEELLFRGGTACFWPVLDQYFVRRDPCPLFAPLAADTDGISYQLCAWNRLRMDGNIVGAYCGSLFH